MGKIFIYFTLLCITSIGGYKVYNLYENTSKSDLFLKNVEALSFEEDGYDKSNCKGVSIYSEVGSYKAEKAVRNHLNDSTDKVVNYSFKQCYANGSGELNGSNGVYDVNIETESESSCLGSKYHNSFF